MSIRQSAALVVLVLVAFSAGTWFSSRKAADTGQQVLYYQDPMHPAYRSDKPGIAPDCGMALVPVYAGSTPAAAAGIRIDPEKQRLLGIRLATVEKGGGERLLRTPGRVAVDTSRLFVINAATEGYFTGVQRNIGDSVEKDELLGTLFVRELRAAALGHLATLDRIQPSADTPLDPTRSQSDRANLGLSLEILRNMSVSDTQIKAIERAREVPQHIELRAPGGGIVLVRNATLGQRFDRGDELFRIADLTNVWILADFFREDAGSIRSGAVARIRVGNPARTLTASVSNAVADFDPVSQTSKVRLIAGNPGLFLKPDMFVEVEISVPMPAGLTVPQDAVLDSGHATSVFIAAGDGSFVPRAVETGWRSGGRVQILKGLAAGDRIVVSGQFLLDSETRMQAHP